MKPHIICHMMMSVDGRIDCAMTEKIDETDNYYAALNALGCPTHLSGKTTMAMHEALPGKFEPKAVAPIGKTSYHKAVNADGYTVTVDTNGSLLWDDCVVEDKPLVCIVSENASKEYTDYLEMKGISWIAVGKEKIDLGRACDILNREFGVERMAVVGGGHINGSFLEAGLLDEVSIMVGPAIDGRAGFPAVFDGLELSKEPSLMHLTAVEKFDNGTVWLRYSLRP